MTLSGHPPYFENITSSPDDVLLYTSNNNAVPSTREKATEIVIDVGHQKSDATLFGSYILLHTLC